MKHHSTAWQAEPKWNNYYQERIIIPNTLKLLDLKPNSSILDLGCGQGILARVLPKSVYYQGVDLSSSLIGLARKQDKNTNHKYLVSDITKPLNFQKFTHAALILSLQNAENAKMVLENASNNLDGCGKLIIVLNHPSFRIPRQSSWGIDEKNKTEYRRVNIYMSDLKIPISMHPGKDSSSLTWSFHQPLSAYSRLLKENGFVIELIEEWVSDKKSEGKAGKMENRARSEFPLFMAIVAKKT